MPSFLQILSFVPALVAVAHGQGVITKAQGTSGSPASFGMQVDLTNTQDANIINKSEITNNVVNECGRTLLAGNIDIGQNTEDLLANKSVTAVTKGSNLAVTINQVNASGAGPYTCDLDVTSNAEASTGQIPLNVTEQDSQGGNGETTLAVTMPSDMACAGASTGNVCTVRCYNKQDFGGCVAVQQTDVTPKVNTVDNIQTAQTLASMLSQVAQNNKGLPAAVKANQEATNFDQQGVLAAAALDPLNSRDLGGKKGRREAKAFFS